MKLAETIGRSGSASDLAAWLADPDGTGTQTMAFLERSLSRVPPTKQKRVIARIQAGDQSETDSVLHELMIHEVCYLLNLHPTFQPAIDDLTPDLELRAAGVAFIADVFITNRPVSTLRQFGGLDGYVDGGEACKKVADAIASKATKYRASGMPLLVFVILGGHDVDHGDLQAALYGSTIGEVLVDGAVNERAHDRGGRHGILCPPGPGAKHDNLSAVIGCDWFDTLNRDDPGRRLHSLVFHHWRPRIPLEPGSFTPFGEIRWRHDISGYVPSISHDTDVVIKTDAVPRVEHGRYTADDPW